MIRQQRQYIMARLREGSQAHVRHEGIDWDALDQQPQPAAPQATAEGGAAEGAPARRITDPIEQVRVGERVAAG
jgi:hypothetical protein